MSNAVKQKVISIIHELAGDRAHEIEVAVPTAQRVIEQALADEYPPELAFDIAFHLTDWQSDAAFIIAVILFPERFTPEEIRRGVLDFIVHAPNHTAAAAKLGGIPVTDVFEIGALDARDS